MTTPRTDQASCVCITGMHRSGTSMVARILAMCGLWLGPAERLMPARADNPDGFFENLDMVALSDELLERFAGGWDAPPDWPAGWYDSPLAKELRPRAEVIVESLATLPPGEAAWAWKDPRACLTLPFWRELRPQLKVVVCLRNPVAVARSLRKRSGSSLTFGVRLWEAYMRQLSASLPDEGVVITHYDAWLINPHAELARVLDVLGLRSRAEAMAEAVELVRTLRTDEGDTTSLLAALGGVPVISLYDRLRVRAGSIYVSGVPDALALAQTTAASAPDVDCDGVLASLQHEVLVLRRRNLELAQQTRAPKRPVALYRLGSTIDGRIGGNAPLYLGEGWAAPQAAGTWSIGPVSKIDLRLTSRVDGPLRVRAKLRPLVGPGRTAVALSLVANGREAGRFTLDEARSADIDALLPPAPAGVLALAWCVHDPRSPRELGISEDRRPLGFLLSELRIEATGSNV